MLLRFSVENHLSFRGVQELTLVASALSDSEDGLLRTPAMPRQRILPAAVVYGANASGKSNLLDAIAYVRHQVRNSHASGDPDGEMLRAPFRLDGQSAELPSTFKVDFVAEGVRYHYGFEATLNEFSSEWLYAFPKNHRQILFERENKKYSFGKNLRGRNRTISDLTRPNSLFLSAAAQNDHDLLGGVARFFSSIRIAKIPATPFGNSIDQLDGDIDDRVISFLERMDTGVFTYRRRKMEIPKELLEIQEAMALALRGKGGTSNVQLSTSEVEVQLGHRGEDGGAVFFDLNRESSGTRRLLSLMGEIYNALDKGSLVLVDEIDSSIHTKASQEILSLFNDGEINKTGAQLVATTHDTNLLNAPGLRRDQIWFTEKNTIGESYLYSLSDLSTKKGDNMEKGYLQGRFGAIPYSGTLPIIKAAV